MDRQIHRYRANINQTFSSTVELPSSLYDKSASIYYFFHWHYPKTATMTLLPFPFEQLSIPPPPPLTVTSIIFLVAYHTEGLDPATSKTGMSDFLLTVRQKRLPKYCRVEQTPFLSLAHSSVPLDFQATFQGFPTARVHTNTRRDI